MALNVAKLLQTFGMAGEIAVGQFQQRLQAHEIQFLVHHQRRHNTQTHLAFKSLVYILQLIPHNQFLSCLK